MLHARCKADVLKTVIEAISTLVDEAKFNVTTDGISIKAVDPAHVAMVEVTLRKSAFEEFKAEGMELGIDMDKFKDVIKLAANDDELDLNYDTENHCLFVKIGNLTRRMSLVDSSGMADPKVPKLDLPGHVTIASGEIEKGIKAAEAVSDHVALIASPQAFELLAEGDTDTVHLKLDKSHLPALDVKENVKSLFSLDYFSNMVRSAKGSQGIHLNIGNDYPVKIDFDIAGGNGHVTYLLAPRIES
ncbi:MAG TPA: proliferating cell nuclear antigen (pcna) [Candidatus Thermoplasmatota archaeon]|nr:proliferating cell nuclear antigen (pcna) [Candidatus Thermoplasmatota archaeon]